EPKIYVDALLEVHSKYNDMVTTAFRGEAGFVASLDKSCREFVNRNKVCKASTSKSPELLARFCDSLLRKSSKNPEENDLEEEACGFEYTSKLQRMFTDMGLSKDLNDQFKERNSMGANEQDTSYTFEELKQSTDLNADVLVGALGTLVKAKVLELSDVRIQLNVPIKSEQKVEVEETHKTVEEDRKLLMQVRKF
ncbi:16965_t:CDS:2, partial [Racocetra fulgida]